MAQNKIVSLFKALVNKTYVKGATEKRTLSIEKKGNGFNRVRFYSYEGKIKNSAGNCTLIEKGFVETNIYTTDPAGLSLFREHCNTDKTAKDFIACLNGDKVRVLQNANRTWDKISEKAATKNAALTIARDCLTGKFGPEAKANAELQFPREKYPSLY